MAQSWPSHSFWTACIQEASQAKGTAIRHNRIGSIREGRAWTTLSECCRSKNQEIAPKSVVLLSTHAKYLHRCGYRVKHIMISTSSHRMMPANVGSNIMIPRCNRVRTRVLLSTSSETEHTKHCLHKHTTLVFLSGTAIHLCQYTGNGDEYNCTMRLHRSLCLHYIECYKYFKLFTPKSFL